MNVEISDVMEALFAVEEILHYRFKNKQLLREALTHPSCNDYASYQRLEFLGDAHLTSAISDYIYSRYPEVDQGKLTLVRSVNISTEKLARVAVRHGLYKHIRFKASDLGKKIEEFVIKVRQENEPVIHGGLVKAPKVLADIVESVAAAIYVDCNNSRDLMWKVMKHLMEPIITLKMLEEEPQPVTLLFELCQREGKQLDIIYWRNGERTIASVYIDGNLVTSSSAEQKENAKLHAAKAALELLSAESVDPMECDLSSEFDWHTEFAGGKRKLHEACVKKKWPKPIYKIHENSGSDHMKTFICSVEIEVKDNVLRMVGKGKRKLKEADNSAACAMFYFLKDAGYI